MTQAKKERVSGKPITGECPVLMERNIRETVWIVKAKTKNQVDTLATSTLLVRREVMYPTVERR